MAFSRSWEEHLQRLRVVLKQRLTSAPVLAFPRLNDIFILGTDASDTGIGGVLSQKQDGAEKVIAYGSHILTKAEQNYNVTRREMLGLIYI